MTDLGDLILTDPIAAVDVTNTPAGGIAATDVQGAINELDTEKPASSAVVLKSLYDANTVLAADTDDTPAALTMGASTILARLAAGNIKAASVSEIITLLQAYTVGGTDVAVTDGGTGASTAPAALINLGVADVPHVRVSARYQYILESTGDATAALVKDTCYYIPYPVWNAHTIDRIGLGVAVAGGATSVVRLGIYNTAASGLPGTLLLDAGTIDGTSNTRQEITISQALSGNTLYWVAVCWQVGTVSSGTVRTFAAGNGGQYVGVTANSTDPRTSSYAQTGVTGAFTTAGTLVNGLTTNPQVFTRIV